MLNHFIITGILLTGAWLSIYTRKLTTGGAIAGGIIGFLVWLGMDYTGIALLAAFFISASLATAWKRSWKEEQDFAEINKGRRNAAQVMANGGAAALFGLLAWHYPEQNTFPLMVTGALSAATADTLSSELGTVYGRRFYNILTWKRDHKGLDGVVSLEGTLFGILGSALIAAIYSIGYGWNSVLWFLLLLAGLIGNIADSILGAALERKGMINNDLVNLLNTVVGAVLCLIFAQ